MAEDIMTGEFITRRPEAEQDSAKEVRSLVEWAKRDTVALDKDPKEAHKLLTRHSVVIFGKDYFTGEPHVVVSGPQLSTQNPNNLADAQNTLISKGITSIYWLENQGKISSDQAQKMRMEMSLGHVGIDIQVQDEKNIFKTRNAPTQKPLENSQLSSSHIEANVSQAKNQHETLSRKKIVRSGIILVSGFALVGCSVVNAASPAREIIEPATPVASQTTAATEKPTNTPESPSKEPTKYKIGAGGGPYTEAQEKVNNTRSVMHQEARLTGWLKYWTSENFKNRPFAPGTKEIDFKKVYDDPLNPTEAFVVIETLGGEYGNQLFAPPLGKDGFVENPPEAEGDYIPEYNYPLNVSGGDKGLILSVENTIPVRRDSDGKVVEILNLETKMWEEANPKVSVEICTPENFLNYEVSVESLFDGSYWEALRNKVSKLFDPAIIKNDVPMANYIAVGNGPNAGTGEITYSFKVPTKSKTPNFPVRGTEPFRRYLTGFTTYQGVTYAVVPTEYFNPQDPNQNVWVLTLFRFDNYDDTDAKKIESMKIWRDRMNVTPILSTNHIPDTKIPDALVARTFAKPDIQQRIDNFVNHNSFKPDGTPINSPFKLGGDIAALDGEVFLTDIHDISLPVYK